jgi:hypothetical protein
MGQYVVRKGKNGEPGIFLKNYNVRLATFEKTTDVDQGIIGRMLESHDELVAALQEMRDSFVEAAKLPGREPSVKMLRDLAHYLRVCGKADAVLAKVKAARNEPA